MTPAPPARQTPPAKKHRFTPEIVIPLREMTDAAGGVYFIAAEMPASDLVVNLPDYVLMVHPPKNDKRPQLVLRMRDEG